MVRDQTVTDEYGGEYFSDGKNYAGRELAIWSMATTFDDKYLFSIPTNDLW